MELRHLRYFVEVAHTGTFRAAADRLHIAQPALWQQVRSLERELGVALFRREGRGVILTEPGRRLLTRAEDALTGAERVAALAADLRAGLAGTVAIAAPAPAMVRVLAAAIARFREAHQGVRIVVREFPQPYDPTRPSARGPVDALLAGEVDLAIGPRTDRVEGLRLYDVSVVAIGTEMPPGRGALPVDELRDRPLLAGPPGTFSRELVANACRESGFEPRFEFESAFPASLLALAHAGLGIAIAADDAFDPREVAAIPVVRSRGKPLREEAWVHWRWLTEPAVAAFVEVLQQASIRGSPSLG